MIKESWFGKITALGLRFDKRINALNRLHEEFDKTIFANKRSGELVLTQINRPNS
jgi:hypothetical protein